MLEGIDSFFGGLNHIIGSVIFFDVLFFVEDVSLPIAVVWLVIGAIYFTIQTKFINIRAFKSFEIAEFRIGPSDKLY